MASALSEDNELRVRHAALLSLARLVLFLGREDEEKITQVRKANIVLV